MAEQGYVEPMTDGELQILDRDLELETGVMRDYRWIRALRERLRFAEYRLQVDEGHPEPGAADALAGERKRTRRGLIRSLLSEILLSVGESGMPVGEIERAVLAIAPTVAAGSTGNELRNGRGKLYEEAASGRWRLVNAGLTAESA